MKKLFFILSVSTLLLASCKKDEICNCGEVVSDDVNDYSVNIKNDCSGNTKKFYLSQDDWFNAHVGSNYCITNTTSW